MITATIELRVDFDSADRKNKEPMVEQFAKEAAALFLTKVTLLGTRKDPQVTVQVGDSWYETKDIPIVDG
jgi:hypothetical protein